MSYDMYRYIFIISTCISIVLLVLSVFLFIKLDIPKIIKDLLGINAKRAIENIRTENEKSGKKVYKPSQINIERGKLTDKITESGRISSKESGLKLSTPTAKLDSEQLYYSEETEVLQTHDMSFDANETTVLEENYEQEEQQFEIEFDITFIHTDEIVV